MSPETDNDSRCRCCWYEYVVDPAIGHSTELTHPCVFERGADHPKADIMAVNTALPAGTDRANIHRCACGVSWLERMSLERRIQ